MSNIDWLNDLKTKWDAIPDGATINAASFGIQLLFIIAYLLLDIKLFLKKSEIC